MSLGRWVPVLFSQPYPSSKVLSGIELSYDGEEEPDADPGYDTGGIQSGAGGYKELNDLGHRSCYPSWQPILRNIGRLSFHCGDPRGIQSCKEITLFLEGGMPST